MDSTSGERSALVRSAPIGSNLLSDQLTIILQVHDVTEKKLQTNNFRATRAIKKQWYTT